MACSRDRHGLSQVLDLAGVGIRSTQGDTPHRRDLEELRYAELDARLLAGRHHVDLPSGRWLALTDIRSRLARCRAILPQRPRRDLTGPRHVAQARCGREKSLAVLCAGGGPSSIEASLATFRRKNGWQELKAESRKTEGTARANVCHLGSSLIYKPSR